MQWLVDLLVQIRASNLGQDATIEIMIAILGVMVGVLSLIITIFSIGLATLGFIGYKDIKRAAKKVAEQIADKVAHKVSVDVAAKEWKKALEMAQANELSEEQAADAKVSQHQTETAPIPANGVHSESTRTRATTDQNLR